MPVVTCPSCAELERLVQGLLPEPAADPLERHLLDCSTCLTRVKTLLQTSDAVGATLQRDPAGGFLSPNQVVEALMNHLESLPALPNADCPNARSAWFSTQKPLDQEVRELCQADETGIDSLTEFLSPPQARDELGRLGQYRILKVLGHGGMGIVYQTDDTSLRRCVALKVMLPTLAASASARRRFLQEAQAMAALDHDHVVRIYQVDSDCGLPFLAMELLKGETLDDRLKREPLPTVAEVLRIGREIALALAAAHATGLIHRDVKPANIWLEGEQQRVKLLDFGLVCAAAQEARLSQPGAIVGTFGYMAPEQVNGEVVDMRCDLFSLGVVLYRLCTGQLPFQGKGAISKLMAVATHEPSPPVVCAPQVPRALSDLVMKLLKKERDQRFASATEVVEALQTLETQPDCLDEAGPTRVMQPRRSPSWSRRRALGVAALALGVLITLGAGTLIRIQPKPAFEVKPLDPDWLKKVAALGAEKRVQAVAAELRVRNPGFDGTVMYKFEGDAVTTLEFLTDQVKDLSPVRALPELRILRCEGSETGRGLLVDLSPLRGLKLEKFNCSNNPVWDLSPLKGMQLHWLHCNRTEVSDLSPLKGMPLEGLHCSHTPLADLSPLKELKALRMLSFLYTKVSDLSPLKDLRLNDLRFSATKVSDLSPLKGVPLETLHCAFTGVSNLVPLVGSKLTDLQCGHTAVSDLSPLKGLPLKKLKCGLANVVDLSPLRGMAIEELSCDFKPERDGDLLRSLKTLKTIKGKPAAIFWKEVGVQR